MNRKRIIFALVLALAIMGLTTAVLLARGSAKRGSAKADACDTPDCVVCDVDPSTGQETCPDTSGTTLMSPIPAIDAFIGSEFVATHENANPWGRPLFGVNYGVILVGGGNNDYTGSGSLSVEWVFVCQNHGGNILPANSAHPKIDNISSANVAGSVGEDDKGKITFDNVLANRTALDDLSNAEAYGCQQNWSVKIWDGKIVGASATYTGDDGTVIPQDFTCTGPDGGDALLSNPAGTTCTFNEPSKK